MPKDKSPHSTSINQTFYESQYDFKNNENKQEYLFERIKEQCLLIVKQIKNLEILREKNILIYEENVQKDKKRIDQKEKFLASSVYRTLKLIKFKFEMIHNHQQSSYFSINSYGQSKFNTEERDRVIMQLFGEANLLCQDYEKYFNKEYSCLKTDKSDNNNNNKATFLSSTNTQSSKIKAATRSISASKSSINSNLETQQKYTSKIKDHSQTNFPNLPRINSHQTIHQNLLEDKTSPPKQQYSNLIENKVQKLVQQFSSPNKLNNQFSSNLSENQKESEHQNSFSFYPHRQNSFSQHKKQFSFDSSFNSILPSNIFQQTNQQIQNESQLNQKMQDINSEYGTVVYQTPCSQQSNLQSSNCSSITICQNISFSTSQNQTSLNEIQRINTSQEQKQPKFYSVNKNQSQKNETINIKQFLNTKNDTQTNSSIRKIKNILKSPDPSNNFISNFSSQNSQYYYHNASQKNISQEYQLGKKSQKSQSPDQTKRNLQSQFEQERARNKTMYEHNNQQQPEQKQIQQNYYFYQSPSNQKNQNIYHRQQQQQQDLTTKALNSKNEVFSKSKFGVVTIEINDQDLIVKDNSNISLNTPSCSTIEQEQQNLNLTKINSTINKNQDQLNQKFQDEQIKFSFSNIDNISSNTNQSNSYTSKRNLQANNKNTSNEQNKSYLTYQKENQYTQNYSHQSQTTIDKENFNVQKVNQSKETKQMTKNATHKKLNSLLQAANTSDYTQNIAGSQQKYSYSNQKRAVASKSPQCKSPISKDTSIYEGSNETNSQYLDSIQLNYQSVNKMISARSNTSQLVSPQRDFSRQKQINLPADLLIGIPVYVRFNNQILLKKKIFDPMSMSIKDAMNLGYLYRIMKFNKQENKIEFFKDKGNQKFSQLNNNIAPNSQLQSPQQSHKTSCFEIINDKQQAQQINFDSKLQLDKFILVQQIKKVSIPLNTQNLQKLQNSTTSNNRTLLTDEKKLQLNNYLLCIDCKDSGQTEFIVNSLQAYQNTYSALCQLISN